MPDPKTVYETVTWDCKSRFKIIVSRLINRWPDGSETYTGQYRGVVMDGPHIIDTIAGLGYVNTDISEILKKAIQRAKSDGLIPVD